MIVVSLISLDRHTVRLDVSGHADSSGAPAERDKVCAAVSHAVMTLLHITGNGTWDGDRSGKIVVFVEERHLRYLGMTLVGLQLLADSYEQHLELPPYWWVYTYMPEEVREWNRNRRKLLKLAEAAKPSAP